MGRIMLMCIQLRIRKLWRGKKCFQSWLRKMILMLLESCWATISRKNLKRPLGAAVENVLAKTNHQKLQDLLMTLKFKICSVNLKPSKKTLNTKIKKQRNWPEKSGKQRKENENLTVVTSQK